MKKQQDSAVACFEEAVRRDDYCLTSHSTLASVCYQRRDYPKALEHLRKVIEYAPYYYDGLTNMATVCAALKDFAVAESVLGLATERFPGFSDILLRVAYTRIQAGRPDDADSLIDDFLKKKPGNRTALALRELGRRSRAGQPLR